MRTQAIEDCRYCPDPSRVAATSGALTLHVVAFLFFLIPVSVVQIPKLVASKPAEPILKARIIEEEKLRPVPPVVPPPTRRIERVVDKVVPELSPIVIPEGREIDIPVIDPPGFDGPEILGPATGASLGASDVPLVPIRMPKPSYPRAELARGIEGEVLVRVRVGLEGAPVLIKLERSSGNTNLDRSALDSARKWRFEPAMRNGAAVEVEATVPVKFSILSG